MGLVTLKTHIQRAVSLSEPETYRRCNRLDDIARVTVLCTTGYSVKGVLRQGKEDEQKRKK